MRSLGSVGKSGPGKLVLLGVVAALAGPPAGALAGGVALSAVPGALTGATMASPSAGSSGCDTTGTTGTTSGTTGTNTGSTSPLPISLPSGTTTTGTTTAGTTTTGTTTTGTSPGLPVTLPGGGTTTTTTTGPCTTTTGTTATATSTTTGTTATATTTTATATTTATGTTTTTTSTPTQPQTAPSTTSSTPTQTSRTPSSGSGSRPFGGVKLGGGVIRVSKNGILHLVIICPKGAVGRCSGAVSLQTLTAVTSGGPHAQRRILTLGASKFSIPAGHRGVVTVRLSRPGRSYLLKHRSLRVRETANARDGLGRRKLTRAVVALRQL